MITGSGASIENIITEGSLARVRRRLRGKLSFKIHSEDVKISFREMRDLFTSYHSSEVINDEGFIFS